MCLSSLGKEICLATIVKQVLHRFPSNSKKT